MQREWKVEAEKEPYRMEVTFNLELVSLKLVGKKRRSLPLLPSITLI